MGFWTQYISRGSGRRASKKFSAKRARQAIRAAAWYAVESLEQRTLLSPTWLAPGSDATWNATTDTLDVAGATTITADPGADEPNVVVESGATLNIQPPGAMFIHLGGLTIDSGAAVDVKSVGASWQFADNVVLVLGTYAGDAAPTFYIDPTGTLDLEDNDLIIHHGGDAGYAQLQQYEQLGSDDGADWAGNGQSWTGYGLTSSAAAEIDYEDPNRRAIGVAENDQLSGDAYDSTAWVTNGAIEPLAPDDNLAIFTYLGDFTLQGYVSFTDSVILSGDYGSTDATWATGDCNDDGEISFVDGVIFDSNYGDGTSSAGPEAPTEPLGTAVSASNDSDLALVWDASWGAVTSYAVTRSDLTAGFSENPVTLTADNGTSTMYTDTTPIFGHTYVYSVAAYNDGATNGLGYTTEPMRFGDVSNLTAAANSDSSVTLNWTHADLTTSVQLDNGDTATCTQTATAVWRSTDGQNWTQLTGTLAANATNYIDSTASAGTTYFYRVQEIDTDTDTNPAADGATSPAASIYAESSPVATLPAAPGGLAIAPGDGDAFLSWNAVAGATSYNVYGGTASTPPSEYTLLASTSAAGFTATTVSSDGTPLADESAYGFEVTAVGAAGEGLPSAAVEVTPSAATITGLGASAASNSEIDLSWDTPDTSLGNIEVDQSTDGINFTQIAMLDAGTAAYQNTGLLDGATYYYRVRTTAGGIYSSFTDPVSATTNYDIDGLNATANSTGQISLTWNDATSFTMLSLYRSIDGGTFEFLTDSYLSPSLSATSTSFTDNTVVEGHDYAYELQGSFADGTLSAMSQASDAETTVVQNLSYTPTTSSIALNWTDLAPAVGSISSVAVGTSSAANGTYTFNTLTSASALTATISGLSENTETWCEVQITDGAGTAVTGPLDTWTLPNAPTAPVVTTSDGTVTVSWSNQSAGSPAYYIESSTDNINFTTIDEVGAGTTNYTDDTPYEGVSYYRVDAVSGDGTNYSSSPSSTALTPLISPSDLSVQAVSSSEADLSWVNNSAVATGITILRSTNGGGFAPFTTLSDPTTDCYADTGLTAGTNYVYEVEATETGSPPSEPCASAGDTTVPATPENLTASAVSSSGINLAWPAVAGATGYDIQRQATGSGDWQTIASPAASSSPTYQDSGLTDGVSYDYQIDAFNDAGTSDFSDTATATTLQTTPIAPGSSDVEAAALSDSQIEIVWTNEAYNETAFEVDEYESGSWTPVATDLAPGTDSYVATGLSADTTYTFRIGVSNAAGEAFSGGVGATTDTAYYNNNWPFVSEMQNAIEAGPDGQPIDGFFAVTKSGELSADQTVSYAVDTTMSDGSTPYGGEYQTLSGSVNIPANQWTMVVPVTPNEINHVEATTDVNLTLTAPTGSGYSLNPDSSSASNATVTVNNTDDATFSIQTSSITAGATAPVVVTYLNHYGRPTAGTINVAAVSSNISVENATVTTGADGYAIVQLLGLAAGGAVINCADQKGNNQNLNVQVNVPQLQITGENITFNNSEPIAKDAGGNYTGAQWNDQLNGNGVWVESMKDAARPTFGFPVAYQSASTMVATVTLNATLGGLKTLPAGTWFISGTADGPNDPAPFFEADGTATIANGVIRVTARITANEALPSAIENWDLHINWFVGFTPSAGSWVANADGPTSVNHLYVTRGLSTAAVYETEYDIGCRAANGKSGEAAVLNAIWNLFSSDNIVMADGKTVLTYVSAGGRTDGDLLRRHQGQCDTWATLLVNVLAAQGIAARRIKVLPPAGSTFIQLKPTSAQGLGAGGNFPNPVFDYHFIVQVKDFPNKLYDPSFGGAPVTGGSLTALENNYEMRIAGVKSNKSPAQPPTPLSGPPVKHLRYSPESFSP